jgi:hypothetical protein
MGAHSVVATIPPAAHLSRAHDGIRTRDLFLTKEVLYRLSYVSTPNRPSLANSTPHGHAALCQCYGRVRPSGAAAHRPFDRSGGNRTPNRRFWRPVLYQLSY